MRTYQVGGQAVLGRQNILPTPWLTERHGYDPTWGWEALHVYYRDHTSIALLLNIRDKNQDIHQISKDLFNILDADIPNPRFHKTGIQELNPKVGLL